MKHASVFYKKEVSKQVVILDLAGMSYAVDRIALNYVTSSLTMDQNNYPERLKKLYILNAPWFFTGIWAIVSPFLDAKTRDKINILGGDFLDTLLQEIDPSQIPVELGGQRENMPYNSEVREFDSDEYCALAVASTTTTTTTTTENCENVA